MLKDVEAAICRHKNDDENNVMSDLLRIKSVIEDDIKKYTTPTPKGKRYREGVEL
jgi:hypothetical protein